MGIVLTFSVVFAQNYHACSKLDETVSYFHLFCSILKKCRYNLKFGVIFFAMSDTNFFWFDVLIIFIHIL